MISIFVSGLTDAFRGVLGIDRGLHSAFGNTFGCGNMCRGYGSFLENLDKELYLNTVLLYKYIIVIMFQSLTTNG